MPALLVLSFIQAPADKTDLIFGHDLGMVRSSGGAPERNRKEAKKGCPEFNYLAVFVTVYVVLCAGCTLILFFVLVWLVGPTLGWSKVV